MTRELVVAQEKALGIQRSAVQLILIDLPDQPESFAFQRLAKAIGNVASFRSIVPEDTCLSNLDALRATPLVG